MKNFSYSVKGTGPKNTRPKTSCIKTLLHVRKPSHLHDFPDTFVVDSTDDFLDEAKGHEPKDVMVRVEVFVSKETYTDHPKINI